MPCLVFNAHAEDALEWIEPESINCCVTSPPYWGLRNYGVNGQIGMEETPEEYTFRIVSIFAKVRRALRADGTLWLNLGDSYTSGGRDYRDAGKSQYNGGNTGAYSGLQTKGTRPPVPTGLKSKDLVGIPWRVAFALQASGWYLRTDIIWSKPNAMPESVRDRPTRSHEYLFLLSKSERYYYDADAIKEDGCADSAARRKRQDNRSKDGWAEAHHGNPPLGLAQKRDKQRGHSRWHAGFNDRWDTLTKEEQCAVKRNKRDVWTIATRPYRGAHFATFPPQLVEPCVLAGCPPGGTVLDPFGGSGTTGEVAERNGRNSILIELNSDYCALIEKRTGYAAV